MSSIPDIKTYDDYVAFHEQRDANYLAQHADIVSAHADYDAKRITWMEHGDRCKAARSNDYADGHVGYDVIISGAQRKRIVAALKAYDQTNPADPDNDMLARLADMFQDIAFYEIDSLRRGNKDASTHDMTR